MKTGLTVALVLLLAASVATAQPAPQTGGKTVPALSKLAADWVIAFNAKDAAKCASFYTDDAVLMPPNESAARGRASIQARWQKAMDDGMSILALTPTESAIAGTQGYETGTYSIAIKPASGPAMTDKGKYVVVLQQVGGQWRLAFDIWNSDMPPPGPPKPTTH